jgi:hypothetical protein
MKSSKTPSVLALQTALSVETIDALLRESCFRGFRVEIRSVDVVDGQKARKHLAIHFDDSRDIARFRGAFKNLPVARAQH